METRWCCSFPAAFSVVLSAVPFVLFEGKWHGRFLATVCGPYCCIGHSVRCPATISEGDSLHSAVASQQDGCLFDSQALPVRGSLHTLPVSACSLRLPPAVQTEADWQL